jgi:hypothetical protein
MNQAPDHAKTEFPQAKANRPTRRKPVIPEFSQTCADDFKARFGN